MKENNISFDISIIVSLKFQFLSLLAKKFKVLKILRFSIFAAFSNATDF